MMNKPHPPLPSGLARNVEREVMDYVLRHPAPPRKFPVRAAAVSALAVFAVVIVFLSGPPEPAASLRNTDFVEQQLVLDNHTAIWLTPIERKEPR